MSKREKALIPSARRMMVIGMMLVLLVSALAFTIFAAAADTPSYFNTENGHAFNSDGEVWLEFGEYVADPGDAIVFFTKDDTTGEFASGTPISVPAGAGYLYGVISADIASARVNGAVLYVAITDPASVQDFDNAVDVSTNPAYVVLESSVTAGDELELQIIEVGQDPALAKPSYFDEDIVYEFNDAGEVRLEFDGYVANPDDSIVFFTKDDVMGLFTVGTPIAVASSDTGCLYSADPADVASVRANGAVRYVAITDHASIQDFDGAMNVSTDLDYVVLESPVTPGDMLVLQKIEMNPEPTFTYGNNVISLTVEKDISKPGSSSNPDYVKAGNTIIVTLELKGAAPAIDQTKSTLGGDTGTWASKIVGTGPSRNIEWTGTFVVPPASAANQHNNALVFKIVFEDSSGTERVIESGDSTCVAQGVDPIIFLDELTAADVTLTCVNSDPYDEPGGTYALAIYDGETMNLSVTIDGRVFSVVSYTVGGTTEIVNSSYGNIYTKSHTLASAGSLADGDKIPVTFELVDEAANTLIVSLANELTYYGRSTPPDYVTITGPASQRDENDASIYYVKQGDPLNITLESSIKINDAQINIAGNIVSVSQPIVRNDNNKRWIHTFYVTLSNDVGLTDRDLLQYEITGKACGSSTSITRNNGNTTSLNSIVYLKALTVDSVVMRSNNASDPQYVIDGEVVTATVKFNHSEFVWDDATLTFKIAGINATKYTGAQQDWDTFEPPVNKAVFYYDSTNKQFIVKYKLPTPNDAGYQANAKDDQVISLVVGATDFAKNSFAPSSVTPPASVTYYAPVEITNVVIETNNASDATLYAKNGDVITVTFTSNHMINVAPAAIAGQNATVSFEAVAGSSAKIWTLTYTLQDGDLADLATVPFAFTAGDAAGNDSVSRTQESSDVTNSITYYAPIEITDLVFQSGNAIDATRYAKNGDVMTITFTSNHNVNVMGSIAGQAAEITSVPVENSNKINWTLTYTLKDGDVTDLAAVPFVFTANDAAQNDPESYMQGDVNNIISYYAPIAATASIVSSNARPAYAKNGETVTVTCDAQHEVAARDYRIGGTNFTGSDAFVNDPIKLSLTIPASERTMSEGIVLFRIELTDPAGNTLTVDQATDSSQVIYDRTAPQVRFAPAFNGATNEDLYLSIVYSDSYLDLNTVSYTVNSIERIPADLKVNGSEPAATFTHQIIVTAEGEYYCTGAITDMAGNRSVIGVSCQFIVDKTNPSVTINLDQNTFAGGFCLDSIFAAEDDLLADIICTVTDSAGVNNWTLSQPMTVEGRKTVLLIAQDLAGNSSIPITCDIYIDTTAPQATVRETTKNIVLASGSENEISVRNGILGVSLAAIHMGDEGPDRFTRLELLDENGTVVANLLDDGALSDGSYSFSLSKRGRYTLVMEAVDGVGNQTGEIRYGFNYSPTQWWLIIILSIAGLLAAAGVGVLIMKRRKEASVA